MITENLSTLKIHKLTQAQYDREVEAGTLEGNSIYLTPDEEGILSVEFGGTGASNAADARFNLGAMGYKRVLTSSDNMDNIKEDGVYVYQTASRPVNAPFPNAAVVEVFGAPSDSTQKIQRAYRYGVSGYTAYRPLYGNTWGDWVKGDRRYEIGIDWLGDGSITFVNEEQSAATLFADLEENIPVTVATSGGSRFFFHPVQKIAGEYTFSCILKSGLEYYFILTESGISTIQEDFCYSSMINKKVITTTTSANGNSSFDLPLASTVVLAVHCVSGTNTYMCTPYRQGSVSSWAGHVTSELDGEIVADTSVEFTIFYAEV